MRTFIAIEIDPVIRSKIARMQAQLKTARADVKWIKPENMHLTIKFLGEQSPQDATAIKEIIDSIASHHATFTMNLTQIGCFPNSNTPRVIWIGIKEKDILEKIAHELEEKLTVLGIEKENRPFKAHVTIGRIKGGKNRHHLTASLKKISMKENLSWTADSIILFKSTLTPSGPIYEKIHESRLQ